MSVVALKIEPQQTDVTDKFAVDLSALCRKYGLGLAGEPTLFLMDANDYLVDYGVNEAGKLIAGYER